MRTTIGETPQRLQRVREDSHKGIVSFSSGPLLHASSPPHHGVYTLYIQASLKAALNQFALLLGMAKVFEIDFSIRRSSTMHAFINSTKRLKPESLKAVCSPPILYFLCTNDVPRDLNVKLPPFATDSALYILKVRSRALTQLCTDIDTLGY
ncbi:hypothetical protein EVAR_53461_1 [Eumeta japonica]|uniref:Uncharacterized protein n=1 Tax=Eumeta variegata TaxID=151549 RepID=A0A4C1XRP8_EUMVA|nr:hypothetical protein EVAR_53461_1 [Eumeta japonica]